MLKIFNENGFDDVGIANVNLRLSTFIYLKIETVPINSEPDEFI